LFDTGEANVDTSEAVLTNSQADEGMIPTETVPALTGFGDQSLMPTAQEGDVPTESAPAFTSEDEGLLMPPGEGNVPTEAIAVLDWNAESLHRTDVVPALDWNDEALHRTEAVPALDWNDEALHRTEAVPALDWNDEALRGQEAPQQAPATKKPQPSVTAASDGVDDDESFGEDTIAPAEAIAALTPEQLQQLMSTRAEEEDRARTVAVPILTAEDLVAFAADGLVGTEALPVLSPQDLSAASQPQPAAADDTISRADTAGADDDAARADDDDDDDEEAAVCTSAFPVYEEAELLKPDEPETLSEEMPEPAVGPALEPDLPPAPSRKTALIKESLATTQDIPAIVVEPGSPMALSQQAAADNEAQQTPAEAPMQQPVGSAPDAPLSQHPAFAPIQDPVIEPEEPVAMPVIERALFEAPPPQFEMDLAQHAGQEMPPDVVPSDSQSSAGPLSYLDFGNDEAADGADELPSAAAVAEMIAWSQQQPPAVPQAMTPSQLIRTQSFYQVIGVNKLSSYEQIHTKFLRLIRRLLQTRYSVESPIKDIREFREILRAICVAHDVLKDPVTRTDYDLRQLGMRAGEAHGEPPPDGKAVQLPPRTRLMMGELLECANILDATELQIALDMHKAEPGVQFGDFLVRAGMINQEELDSALLGQRLISAGKITVAQFQTAMFRMRDHGSAFFDTLMVEGWLSPSDIFSEGSILWDGATQSDAPAAADPLVPVDPMAPVAPVAAGQKRSDNPDDTQNVDLNQFRNRLESSKGADDND
jgi:hypothetical protein